MQQPSRSHSRRLLLVPLLPHLSSLHLFSPHNWKVPLKCNSYHITPPSQSLQWHPMLSKSRSSQRPTSAHSLTYSHPELTAASHTFRRLFLRCSLFAPNLCLWNALPQDVHLARPSMSFHSLTNSHLLGQASCDHPTQYRGCLWV